MQLAGHPLRSASNQYWWAAAAVAAIALLFLRAGWRRSGQQRAMLTGPAAGLVFGISDALTRVTVQVAGHHPFFHLLATWPACPWSRPACVGLWLMESSFNAAPLNASLPAITAAEPVAGICLGVVVFGDVVRVSPGLLALQAAGILALVIGVVLVARAPMLSSLRTVRACRTRPAAPEPAAPEPAAPEPEAPDAAPAGAAGGPRGAGAADPGPGRRAGPAVPRGLAAALPGTVGSWPTRKLAQPDWLEPELATLTQDRFSDPAWLYERKFDGERCLAYRDGRPAAAA